MSDLMNDMHPITPLGANAPRVDTYCSVTLTENTETALASFASRRGHEVAAEKALAAFIGMKTLPGPGRAALGEIFGAVWMGPEQWMILAPHASHEDLAARLERMAAGCASITEQNDAWCRFDLEGPELSAMFERLCPMNMRACHGGEATRTSIDHLGCIVLVHTPQSISVLGPRSSAGSLHHALLTAMKSAY